MFSKLLGGRAECTSLFSLAADVKKSKVELLKPQLYFPVSCTRNTDGRMLTFGAFVETSCRFPRARNTISESGLGLG